MRRFFALALLFASGWSAAATPPHEVQADWPAGIAEAIGYRNRFAIPVSHAIDAQRDGEWSRAGTGWTWIYAVRVPGAVSLSFHAPRVHLPPGATLTMQGGGESFVYSGRQLSRPELWSRIVAGDTLSLEISVDDSARAALAFEVDALQAGFRGLGGALPDHPVYARMKSLQATAPQECLENFKCCETAGNAVAGKATVAVIISGVGQCTGTLLNDTQGDGAPYVLTARHCQNGKSGGGQPGAASSVTVYWHATTPCGQTLGSIYTGSVVSQSGATTVVEQQDAWLIRLNEPPVVDDAWFAGWDATGGAIVGGYSVHHAIGLDQLFTRWYGQSLYEEVPAGELDVTYRSTFWSTVNDIGSIGAGASGSALFDNSTHVIGALSLGRNQADSTDRGVCPTVPPVAPNVTSITATFTALSGVWDSTADTTSTTNPRTLRQFLDPIGTGQRVISGQGAPPPVSLWASPQDQGTGDTTTLEWTSSRATSCTASGGVAGDGWAGAVPTSGTRSVTSYSAGATIYRIACTDGQLTGRASTIVTWIAAAARVSLSYEQRDTTAGQPAIISWYANTPSCTASGGSAGDGWSGTLPSNGTRSVTAAAVGSFHYVLNCSIGDTRSEQSIDIAYTAPQTTLTADATTLRIGQIVKLNWFAGGRCSRSGGGAGDGWATASSERVAELAVTETIAGTYVYTVTCSGGGLNAPAQVTVVFTAGAPRVTLTTTPTQQPVPGDPGGFFGAQNVLWDANVRPCALTFAGPLSGTIFEDGGPRGSLANYQYVAGLFTYTMVCGTGADRAQATATINWTTALPRLAVSPQTLSTYAGQGFFLQWDSNQAPCTGSGGVVGDRWTGPVQYYGTVSLNIATVGTYVYTMTCGTAPQLVRSATVTVTEAPPPTLTFTADRTEQFAGGSPVRLEYTSNIRPCTISGGTLGSGSQSGYTASFSVSETVPGDYVYTVRCEEGARSIQKSLTIRFIAVHVSFSADKTTARVNEPVTLSWSSNSPSNCEGSGGYPYDGWNNGTGWPATGSTTVTAPAEGLVSYRLRCGSVPFSQVDVMYRVAAPVPTPTSGPTITLSATNTSVVLGSRTTISWSTDGASSCESTGGTTGDGWAGTGLPLAGDRDVTPTAVGAQTYLLTCRGSAGSTTSSVTVNVSAAPTATLGSSAPTAQTGQAVTLTWSSTNATGCTAGGGSTGDGWSGTRSTSGSASVTATAAGSVTYTLACAAGTNSSPTVSTSVSYSAPPASSGGGGGGALGGGTLAGLAALLALRRQRRATWTARRAGPQRPQRVFLPTSCRFSLERLSQ